MQNLERLKTQRHTNEIAQTPFTEQDRRDIERAEGEGMFEKSFPPVVRVLPRRIRVKHKVIKS